ncbi:hypothetical protein [Vineibacter terrae]|uniref:Uncharacterized protein n=1 Tax=Vineibacter terrae TaxID=2586908 RepID=A0A5C8PP57_9HYPH|nr:hypothetical protein [Vineibacter terrae]TXL76309.1 hypothetical protein FHP25_11690 [Vineibacter terrae]HEX2885505.1 hypothetical protein [Vineibacter terrae]
MMVERMLKVEITGAVLPSNAHVRVPCGEYMATEIKQPSADGGERRARLDEPTPPWRLRKIDAEGRPVPSGPAFVLTFRDLAEYIGARHMRVVEGDFV